MTPDIALVLALLAAATLLFATDYISAEVVAIALVVSFVLCGVIDTADAFAGFGSDTVVMIFGLLVLTAGLERTGVVDIAGRFLTRRTNDNPQRLLLLVMITAALLSAFISNTAATAFFVPVVFGAALRAKESPSRYLLPLAFAAILASSVTLVSTSTNIVVSELLVRRGYEPMGFFELTPVGVPILVAGLLYMWFIGRPFLPARAPAESEDLGNRLMLSEALVLPDSALVGKTILETKLAEKLDITIVRLIRNKQYRAPRASTVIEAGDSLLLEGKREEILKIKELPGIDLKADAKLVDPEIDAEDLTVAEGIIMPHSFLIGRTLKALRFRERYDLQVLGVARAGSIVKLKLSELRLRMGDILLLQGLPVALKTLESFGRVSMLGTVTERSPVFRRAPIAAAIFALALIFGAAKLVPLSLAVILGALAMFFTRCITTEEAFREVDWRVVLLIGAMLGVGPAMEKSGTAAYLAHLIAGAAGGADPLWLLAGFFGLTLVLTQAMSNQGAAVVVLPVAVITAVELGLNPRAFAMMIALAASCSYLTPLEPACLLVYGPGRYRFRDFFFIGAGLTVLILALSLVLVPVVWPLAG